MNNLWNIAIYARVSTDKKEQSESIPVQIENLKKWILEKSKEDIHGIYTLVDIYKDQGKSGSTFHRDAFIRMKKDIEDRKINMVVTRDLSRFSRNYILAGYYLEDYFKVNNIRFISVLDNVDTEKEFDDIIPFKNIINEMFIKDCSRKVRSALTARMERGSSIASKVLYGYKFYVIHKENQKTVLLTPAGDETTEIVREIFSRYLSGWGVGKISTYLNNKGVPPPSSRINNFGKAKFGLWSNSTIMSILRNPKYGGYMVQGRSKKVSYKVNKISLVPEENWIFGGEFEGIISKEDFKKTQEMMKKRKENNYRYRNGVIHPFSTVLKCGKCGGTMTYKKKYEGYKCVNSQQGSNRCSPHSVKEEALIEIVSSDMKRFIDKKIDKEAAYNKFNNIDMENNSKEELVKVNNELSLLDLKLKRIYEDRLRGALTDRNFNNMLGYIQQQQEEVVKKKNQLLIYKNNYEYDGELLLKYKPELRKFLEGEFIDRNLIETLIDKIIVEELGEKKEKQITIYYKFKNEQ